MFTSMLSAMMPAPMHVTLMALLMLSVCLCT